MLVGYPIGEPMAAALTALRRNALQTARQAASRSAGRPRRETAACRAWLPLEFSRVVNGDGLKKRLGAENLYKFLVAASAIG